MELSKKGRIISLASTEMYGIISTIQEYLNCKSGSISLKDPKKFRSPDFLHFLPVLIEKTEKDVKKEKKSELQKKKRYFKEKNVL